MKIKTGKPYKVRILSIGKLFYPQIFIKSFLYRGWYFIDMESTDYFTGKLGKPTEIKSWNNSLEEAESIITKLKENFQTIKTKIYNEREEQF